MPGLTDKSAKDKVNKGQVLHPKNEHLFEPVQILVQEFRLRFILLSRRRGVLEDRQQISRA